jgi:hypothetical protein
MKKVNFQVIATMLFALLFTNVVPATELTATEPSEEEFCFILCEIPPMQSSEVPPQAPTTVSDSSATTEKN